MFRINSPMLKGFLPRAHPCFVLSLRDPADRLVSGFREDYRLQFTPNGQKNSW